MMMALTATHALHGAAWRGTGGTCAFTAFGRSSRPGEAYGLGPRESRLRPGRGVVDTPEG